MTVAVLGGIVVFCCGAIVGWVSRGMWGDD